MSPIPPTFKDRYRTVIPISYKKTISKSTLMFLEMQGIELLEGDVWGHRKDINEFYEI